MKKSRCVVSVVCNLVQSAALMCVCSQFTEKLNINGSMCAYFELLFKVFLKIKLKFD